VLLKNENRKTKKRICDGENDGWYRSKARRPVRRVSTFNMSNALAVHLRRTAFEKALFSDVSVTFAYGALPFSITYDLHKVILMQSSFFNELMQEHHSQQEGRIQFTIDLQRALAYKGFLPTLLAGPPVPERRLTYRILGSHIAFNLCWLYESDKQALLETLQPDDIIRVLILSILFDISDLTRHSLRLYMSKRLAVETIVSDLHLIGQLPHSSSYYHELRDAALLVLFRNGAENAESLCELPMDWMQDILSAELLFVQGEFDRYTVLKRVLQTFTDEVENTMRMNDSEAIERNKKRLSSFASAEKIHVEQPGADITAEEIRLLKRKRSGAEDQDTDGKFLATRPSRYKYNHLSSTAGHNSLLPAGSPYRDQINILRTLLNDSIIYSNMTFSQLSTVRADSLVEEGTVFRALWQREALERLVFPTVDLKADKSHDTSNNEVLTDRHDALSEYFDVSSTSGVNQTSIAKKRRSLLGTPKFRFGTSIQLTSMRKSEWKEEMIFTGHSDDDEADAFESMLSDPNGELASYGDFESEDEIDQENAALLGEHWQGRDHSSLVASKLSSKRALAQLAMQNSKESTGRYINVLRNTFYSTPRTILGTRYRVRVEAFVLSFENSLKKLVCNFELQRSKGKIDFRRYQIRRTARESLEALAISQHEPNSNSAVVRSKTTYSSHSLSKRLPNRQPTPSRIPSLQTPPTKMSQDYVKHEKTKSNRRRASSTPPKPSIALLKELEGAGEKNTKQVKEGKLRYSIYCLNRHCVADVDSHALPSVEMEDRAFMPVSRCEEMSEETDEKWLTTEKVPGNSYTTNVILTDGIVATTNIDVMVVMELFDLNLS
jgi:hypothetical protein